MTIIVRKHDKWYSLSVHTPNTYIHTPNTYINEILYLARKQGRASKAADRVWVAVTCLLLGFT